jgi:subtilisin family serine protease
MGLGKRKGTASRAMYIWLVGLALVPGPAAAQTVVPINPSTARKTADATAPAWVSGVEKAASSNQTVEAVVQYQLLPAAEESEARAQAQGQYSPEITKQALATSRSSLIKYLADVSVEILTVYDYQPLVRVRLNAVQARDLGERPEIVNVHLLELFSNEDSRSQAAALATERQTRQTSLGLEKSQDSNTDGYVNADKAWARGYQGQGYAVAILDNGINATHEMFSGKIVTEGCFSSGAATNASLCPSGANSSTGVGAASTNCSSTLSVCEHGSHVAGIAAGNNHGTIFVNKGVAPEAKIVPVQVFHREISPNCDGASSCLRASNFDIASALDWLIANATTFNVAAVNMSLGSGTYALYCDSSSILTAGINTLRKMNILTVIAAGNDGDLNVVSHPACIKSAVAVSSSIISVPDSSVNQSPLVSLLAPGFLVYSAGGTGTSSYVFLSGTSMATPHVAGAAAVLRSRYPAATADQLQYAMVSTGKLVDYIGWTWKTPLLDVNAALDKVTATPPPAGMPLMSLLSGAVSQGNSYLRFINADTKKGHVHLTLLQDTPKTIVGTYDTDVAAGAAIQVTLKDIETAIGSAGTATSLETAYVDANFKGYIQNIVWNQKGQALTNLTSCPSTAHDPQTLATNVHTSLISGTYPSQVIVFNSGLSPAIAAFDVLDSQTGIKVGSFQTSSAIQPNTSFLIDPADVFKTINFTPAPSQFHLNFKLQSGFTGIVQHVVQNNGAGVLTDMSVKCPLS